MNCTQTNKLDQRVTWRMELANGEMPQLGLYLQRLMRTQDLEAWKADPGKFDAWVKTCLIDYVNGITFGIVTYATPEQPATATTSDGGAS